MKVSNYNVGVNAGTNKGDLTLAIDPLIYLWNPFNVTLKAERYAIELQRGHGGKMSFMVVKPDNSEQKYGPAKTDIYMKKEAGGAGNLTYLVRDLVIEPGEVMIVSPGNGTDNTALHDEATPGTNLTDLSGISTTWMPTTTYDTTNKTWVLQNWTNGVKVGPGDTIRCLYDICLWHSGSNNMTNSAEHYWMATFMPYNKDISPNKLLMLIGTSTTESMRTGFSRLVATLLRALIGVSRNTLCRTYKPSLIAMGTSLAIPRQAGRKSL